MLAHQMQCTTPFEGFREEVLALRRFPGKRPCGLCLCHLPSRPGRPDAFGTGFLKASMISEAI